MAEYANADKLMVLFDPYAHQAVPFKVGDTLTVKKIELIPFDLSEELRVGVRVNFVKEVKGKLVADDYLLVHCDLFFTKDDTDDEQEMVGRMAGILNMPEGQVAELLQSRNLIEPDVAAEFLK